MTLPDEKENYIHRIGRVGRAERMGLAISLVGTHKEKVWYCFQGCPSKGKLPCSNTKLKNDGGCTIWYDEKQVSSIDV
jgi:ATP-dependent RNA helicase DDX1